MIINDVEKLQEGLQTIRQEVQQIYVALAELSTLTMAVGVASGVLRFTEDGKVEWTKEGQESGLVAVDLTEGLVLE